MAADQHLNELVQRLRSAVGENLICVALHGSAATEEFHPEFSDLNLLCIVGELSVTAMQALSPALNWWSGLKYPAPLFFTRGELQRVADVFPIEMLDIKNRHRILHGEDLFEQLQVPMALHRVQLEHEIRTKLLFLRQHYMTVSQDQAKVRHLMLDSVSNFLVLFRHALIAMGETPPQHKREVAQRLGARVGFDPGPFEQLLQVRERKLKADALEASQVFAAYLQAIEKVIHAVDSL
jgi:hypothetical protein